MKSGERSNRTRGSELLALPVPGGTVLYSVPQFLYQQSWKEAR